MTGMKLGYFYAGYGHHVASCRHPEALTTGGMNYQKIIEQAKLAEQAKFDFLFISDNLYIDKKSHPDSLANIEPLTLLSVVATETTHLGLVATASTTFSEPYQLARNFASLDHLSDGRAGWNIVTSGVNDTAKNFNGNTNVDHNLRYDQAAEFLDITLQLWNSWRDITLDNQQVKGRDFNGDLPTPINYEGQFYSVKGPLNISESPQTQPLLVQAGSSKKGTEFAAQSAEVVFTAQNDLDDAIAFAANLKKQVKQQRGEQQDVIIMPGIFPVIGSTQAEAEANYQELQNLILPEIGLELLSQYLGNTDVSGYDLDTPFEDIKLNTGNSIQSRVELIKDTARKNNLTLDDVMKHVAGARGHHIVVGTPQDVADRMEQWFNNGAADGFNIMPPLNPTQFELFVDKVIPILRERKLIQHEYSTGTLREKLGLNNNK